MILTYDPIKHRGSEDLKKALEKLSAKPFRELLLSDLVLGVTKNSVNNSGIYLIYDANGLAYIGKAGSRSIIERISSHFDLRPESWFNNFLKKAYWASYAAEGNHINLLKFESTYLEILNHYSIKLIIFSRQYKNTDVQFKAKGRRSIKSGQVVGKSQTKKAIANIEKSLIKTLKPRLNGRLKKTEAQRK